MPIDLITARMRPVEDVKSKGFTGFLARGLFFKLLSQYEQGLASVIHDFKGIAPYSVSPIFMTYNGRLEVRFTSFMTRISKALLDALSSGVNIKIAGGSVEVEEVEVARIDTLRLMKEARAISGYILDFKTPTCFRRPSPYIPLHTMGIFARIMGLIGRPKSRYRFYPLPDPILMLRNLKRQWEQYIGGLSKGRRFTKWIEEGGIAVAGVENINTHRFVKKGGDGFIVGFTGKVRITLPSDTYNQEYAKIVNLLLRMGEYTQTGLNRTAGFGVYRIVRERRS